jgi:hypothetical protein
MVFQLGVYCLFIKNIISFTENAFSVTFCVVFAIQDEFLRNKQTIQLYFVTSEQIFKNNKGFSISFCIGYSLRTSYLIKKALSVN